jgi:hypothetical protein
MTRAGAGVVWDWAAGGYGDACFSAQALDIVALHLQRFLAPALIAGGGLEVHVLLGFEGASLDGAWLRVSAQEAEAAAENAGPFAGGWKALVKLWRTHATDPDQLLMIKREGSDPLYVGAMGGEQGLEGPLLGFVMAAGNLQNPPAGLMSAVRRAGEALRAARHNIIRLLFEPQPQPQQAKDFLYNALASLPDLCGCDHSAALILTNDLAAMTLEHMALAEFEIVAERMFYDRDLGTNTPERLVGLVIAGTGEHSGLLGAAFAQIQKAPEVQPHIFLCDDSGNWYAFAEPAQSLPRFATRVQRPQEQMSILIPLLHDEERGAREMLGFLAINYRLPRPLEVLDQQLMIEFSARLAHYLRHSPLFNLSSRQMLLVERVRHIYNDTIGQGGAVKRLESLIQTVNADIAKTTRLPCFAIGYLSESNNKKTLRFIHPHGFTRFNAINLSVEPTSAADLTQSSIAALAVRLGRPIVLAGAQDTPQNRNALYIHEPSKRIIDARVVDLTTLDHPTEWHRLHDYYKPSRDHSYATLAFPIQLGHDTLGVVAIEVDRDTDWFWWTGFGSKTFYRLLASELAVAFKLMGVAQT